MCRGIPPLAGHVPNGGIPWRREEQGHVARALAFTDPMKISIKVKPNSKERTVEEVGPNQFFVKVKSPPKEGKANQEVIESLASYFGVPKSKVTIAAGLKSSQKIVVIESMD